MARKLVAAAVLLIIGACSAGGPNLSGDWKGRSGRTMEVSKEGDIYKVVYPKGSGRRPLYGKYQDGAIIKVVTMCGDITYSNDNDKLYFCNEELSRVKK